MKILKNCCFLLFAVLISLTAFSQNVSPVLSATGSQSYCPGSDWMNIATSFNITDPDDTGADAVYVQISEGYISTEDIIDYRGSLNVLWTYDPIPARLKISSYTGDPLSFSDIIYIVNNVFYKNNSLNPTPGVRKFSITIGDASYLPSTGHYYRFVSQNGISWENARQAASNSTYFGLQGYLATIVTAEEAQFVGEQTRVTGWIGGSDAQTEGVWRWVTGPEAGTLFWNGGPNGSSPNYAHWNGGEPNNADGGEDYAHITARGIGTLGSWNDLPNVGGSGDYIPKGYIVEYGGMPGDPVLNIAAHTTITVSPALTTTDATSCGPGSVTLQAQATGGTIAWYSTPTGGAPIATGNSFTTPVLTANTIYFAAISGACSNTRKPVTAYVVDVPTVTVTSPVAACGTTPVTLQATPSTGTVYWFTTATGGTPVGTGNNFTTAAVSANTTFYAETVTTRCTSARVPVSVIIGEVPQVTNEEVYFCENGTAVLDAGIPSATYAWPGGVATRTITVQDPGIYNVTITNTTGCSATKTFMVKERLAPVITSITVSGRTVTVNLESNDTGNYEFSLDGITFQTSNIFTDVQSGLGSITVKEMNECGQDAETFVVYIIPTFFTPNNDNSNDLFYVEGMSLYPNAKALIFDRYGRLIRELNRSNPYWDGTYSNEKLPASDYWYIIKLDDSIPEIKGHFSLLR